MSSAPAPSGWVLFGAEGYVGGHFNESTTTCLRSKGVSIMASFFPNRPPQPSKLCVHCPDAEDVDSPRVLCFVGDLILFRVAVVGCLPIDRPSSLLRCDYFIYRAEPNRSMLKLLPNLPSGCTFRDFEVGILPRDEDEVYTIAALVPIPSSRDRFELLLFQSRTWTWTSMMLSVVPPQREFSVEVPGNGAYFFRHYTTSVITLGGEYGTNGWVDLWRGVLLCDVLSENLTLRYVPLPPPVKHITRNKALGLDLDRARNSRGIAFLDGLLKLVQLDLTATQLVDDEETGCPTMQVEDWTVTTWSNKTTSMTDSYQDWHSDGWTLQASKVTINEQMVSHSTGSLLLPSQLEDDNDTTVEQALHNLVVSDPLPPR
jgi:hypothetical protein